MDSSVSRTAVTAFAFSSLLLLAGGGAQAAGDPASGKTLFARCAICHKVTKDGGNGLGPNLFGVGGRKAGTAAGFAYSTAMKNSGITWTEEKLEAYIADPKGTVPGNKMAFAGLSNHSQADDVAAYLMTLK
jgi:cytochrome c